MEIKVSFLANVKDNHDMNEVSRALQKCGAEIVGNELYELQDIGCFKVERTDNAGEQVAGEISNAVNCNDKEFLQQMLDFFSKDHRFLQGQEIKAMLTFMKMFSEVGTDGRNKYEVEFMKKIVNYIENDLQYGKIPSKF